MGWPPTKAEIRTAIRKRLSDTSAVPAEQDFVNADYDEAIDWAYRELALDLHVETGASVDNVGAMVANQHFYIAKNQSGARVVLQCRLGPIPGVATDVDGDKTLISVRPSAARRMMSNNTIMRDSIDTGEPTHWWIEPRSVAVGADAAATETFPKVGIFPAPDATIASNTQLIIRVSKVLTVLDADADVFQLPVGADKALIYKVASELAEDRGDNKMSDRHEARYQKAFLSVLRDSAQYDDVGTEAPVDVYRLL